MGNDNNCCCISRTTSKKQLETPKIPLETFQVVKKPRKKPLKTLEKPIQDYTSPDIQDFLSRINTKSTDLSLTPKLNRTETQIINTPEPDEKNIPNTQPITEDVIFIDLPDYTLDSIATLSETQQKEITWLLTQHEATEEEIDGFLPVKKQNRYKIKQHRWLLFTNLSVYLVMPHNFLICRNQIKLIEIINIYSTNDSKLFSLEILNTQKYFLSFYSDRTPDALGALQTLIYFVTNQLKEIIIVKSEKDIIKKTESPVFPLDNDLLFINIKADYGFPGEKIVLDYEVYVKNERNQRVLSFIFMTNKTLYVLDEKKRLFNFVENERIFGTTLIENFCQGIIHSEDGDVWLVSLNSLELIEDVREVLLKVFGEMIGCETVELKDVKFRPMDKMKKSKRRKVPDDYKILNQNEKSVHNLNVIDDIIRAI